MRKLTGRTNVMKRDPVPRALGSLVAEVRSLIQSARHMAASTVNTLQVRTNFEIGRRIVEHEQKGEKRAGYGQELLKALSARLTAEFGQGFSVSNLQLMRKFFIEYKFRIQQQAAVKLTSAKIQQPDAVEFSPVVIAKPSQKPPFTLSWTHYVLLLTVKDPGERSFYEIEAASEGWSIPELKRQVAACLYERLALSRSKTAVRKLAREGQIVTRPEDILKEPYVLEFLGLNEKSEYSENDLETAIIIRLEHFLLELGKGFLFEARQKRFTFDEDHFYVDLVFYNRLLRCYVLIDLKLDKLTHQDLGPDADVCEPLQPEGEAATGEPHHRHPAVQAKKRCHRRGHLAAGCQHPRQGIQALPALQGRTEAQAAGVGRGASLRAHVRPHSQPR